MTQNIEGDYPPITRVETGWWSLDRALSNKHGKGWPMTIYELFGFAGVGKTTVATSIAGKVAEQYKGNIVYAPIEHVDRDLMADILDSVSFTGKTTILGGWDTAKNLLSMKQGKEDVITDEIILNCMREALRRDEYVFGILDSLTAISPIEEMESSLADKNMGRRARLAGALVRALLQSSRFRSVPSSTILLSHKSTSMGSTPTNTGSSTTGGESKKNLAKVRISLRRIQEATMYELENNCYIVEGFVEKSNFSKDKQKFYLAILGGAGVHTGMTALYDCKMAGLATFGASITLDGKKYGRMSSIVEKAHAGDSDFFTPFIEALKNPSKVSKPVEDESDIYLDEENA